MQILIFSDLHGKIQNIEELFGSINFDDYIFAGDIFGYFTCGEEVTDLLIKNHVKFILGNHDMYFLRELSPTLFDQRFGYLNEVMITGDAYNQKYGCLYDTVKKINKSTVDYLFESSLSENFSIHNLRFFVHHGSPYNSFDQYIYPDYEKMNQIFEDFDFDVMILGHTHKPFIKLHQIGNRIIINPGSCSLPRGNSLPTVAIFDTQNMSANLKKLKQKINFKRETYTRLKELI